MIKKYYKEIELYITFKETNKTAYKLIKMIENELFIISYHSRDYIKIDYDLINKPILSQDEHLNIIKYTTKKLNDFLEYLRMSDIIEKNRWLNTYDFINYHRDYYFDNNKISDRCLEEEF